MARKVVNRKELRAENEAAEQAGTTKKKAKKKAAKRASRAKSVADVLRFQPKETGGKEGDGPLQIWKVASFRAEGQRGDRGVVFTHSI